MSACPKIATDAPNRGKPNKDTDAPTLPTLLSDNVLPKKKKSTTDRDAPRRVAQQTDREDPNLAMLRRAIELPSRDSSNTDNDDPMREI
jgi:hypothetical protein